MTFPQEDRLREEAAKRLERRRKKMLSPEERLARSYFVYKPHLTFGVGWIDWRECPTSFLCCDVRQVFIAHLVRSRGQSETLS